MRGKKVAIFLQEEDIKELENRAKRLGLKLSTYVRVLIKNSLQTNEI